MSRMHNTFISGGGEESACNIATVLEDEMVKVRIEEEREQLLPGILDEITISMIAPKLSWSCFYVLSSVNRGWQRAIQSHRIYNARVRSQSTQSLVVLNHDQKNLSSEFVLCSLENGFCHDLPPIPGSQRIPYECECIALDGRLYVLGGIKKPPRVVPGHILGQTHVYLSGFAGMPQWKECATADVYVLDLVGHCRWKQCASMKDPRARFGCGVSNGKIYVFWGVSNSIPVCGSEVYDPKEDVWTSISPLITPMSSEFRFGSKVLTVGDELFVHNDTFGFSEAHASFDGYISDISKHAVVDPPEISIQLKSAFSAVVYHPIKNEWRIVEQFTESCLDMVVSVGGKLNKISSHGIHVYDIHANSWKFLKSIGVIGRQNFYTCDTNEPRNSIMADVVSIDDELFAKVVWRHIHEEMACDEIHYMTSQGLGDQNKEIVWKERRCHPAVSSKDIASTFMCPIEL